MKNNLKYIKNNLESLDVHFLEKEPMKKHTTFGIGGPADIFILPKNNSELSNILSLITKTKIDFHFIGSGSNILVHDDGIKGIIISLKKSSKKIIFNKSEVYADCGVMLGTFVKELNKRNITGYESLIGVPGTLGGALIMNAGAYGSEISNNLISVESIDYMGNIKNYKVKSLNFAYRESSFPKNELLLNATFKCKKGNKEIINEKKINASNQRKEKQPLKYRSAGSIFKNPSPKYAAGYLIDQSGLKGLEIGGAQISTKHANFIINKNNKATYKDVIELIEIIKKKILLMFNIKLELEIKIIGKDI